MKTTIKTQHGKMPDILSERIAKAKKAIKKDEYEKDVLKFEASIFDFSGFVDGYIGIARLASKRCDWGMAFSS